MNKSALSLVSDSANGRALCLGQGQSTGMLLLLFCLVSPKLMQGSMNQILQILLFDETKLVCFVLVIGNIGGQVKKTNSAIEMPLLNMLQNFCGP